MIYKSVNRYLKTLFLFLNFKNFSFLQKVRLCLKFWTNELKMPSKSEMLADTEVQMKKQWDKNEPKRRAHLLGSDQV